MSSSREVSKGPVSCMQALETVSVWKRRKRTRCDDGQVTTTVINGKACHKAQ
jgi:hypothetical protein